jgi:hypothetical protein
MSLHGIDLSTQALEKIYHLNFEKMAGVVPKPVDIDKALRYVEEMVDIYEGSNVPFYNLAFPLLEYARDILKKL